MWQRDQPRRREGVCVWGGGGGVVGDAKEDSERKTQTKTVDDGVSWEVLGSILFFFFFFLGGGCVGGDSQIQMDV